MKNKSIKFLLILFVVIIYGVNASASDRLEIRSATLEESEKYLQFEVEPDQKKYISLDILPEILKSKKISNLYGAFDTDSNLVGIAYIAKKSSDFLIDEFAIDKKYQKKGFGKEFLSKLIESLKQKSCSYIYAEIATENKSSQNLFKGSGFVNLGEDELDEDDHLIYQTWRKDCSDSYVK